MQALIKDLAQWFSREMDELYWGWPEHTHGWVLMGCPVWGKTYRERFERYCLPTLAAPENLAALRGRCRLVVFCGGEDRAPLLRMLKPLEHHGIKFVLRTIPAEILAHNTERDSYPILGAVQNILIQMAGRYCMALHMLMPDHTYPERYVPNMFRLGEAYEAVVQCGISASIESAAAEIESYRTPDKELVIPSEALGDIGYRHLHKRMKMLLVNDAPEGKMPHSHFLMYRGRDRLRIHSPHMNPVWLSTRLCLKTEMPRDATALIATIDTRLPGLIDGTPTYIVQPEDEMTVVEVADKTKGAPSKYVDFEAFAMTAWRQIGFSGSFQPFFDAGTEIPIAPHADSFMTDEEITQHHRLTVIRMLTMKPELALEAYQRLVGTWKPKTKRSPLEAPEDYAEYIRGIRSEGRGAEGSCEEAALGCAEGDRGRERPASGDGREGDRGEEDRTGADDGGALRRPAANGAAGGVLAHPEAGL